MNIRLLAVVVLFITQFTQSVTLAAITGFSLLGTSGGTVAGGGYWYDPYGTNFNITIYRDVGANYEFFTWTAEDRVTGYNWSFVAGVSAPLATTLSVGVRDPAQRNGVWEIPSIAHGDTFNGIGGLEQWVGSFEFKVYNTTPGQESFWMQSTLTGTPSGGGPEETIVSSWAFNAPDTQPVIEYQPTPEPTTSLMIMIIALMFAVMWRRRQRIQPLQA